MQSRVYEGSRVDWVPAVWVGFVEKVGFDFEPGVKRKGVIDGDSGDDENMRMWRRLIRMRLTEWNRRLILKRVMPRLHHDTCRSDACIPDEQLVWYIYVDGYHTVARLGYLLTVSRRHNYYSFMSRSTCILCIQQQTGDKLATVLLPIHVDGDKWIQLVSGNMYASVNAA